MNDGLRDLYSDLAATLPIIIVFFSPTEKTLTPFSIAISADFNSLTASDELQASTLSV